MADLALLIIFVVLAPEHIYGMPEIAEWHKAGIDHEKESPAQDKDQ